MCSCQLESKRASANGIYCLYLALRLHLWDFFFYFQFSKSCRSQDLIAYWFRVPLQQTLLEYTGFFPGRDQGIVCGRGLGGVWNSINWFPSHIKVKPTMKAQGENTIHMHNIILRWTRNTNTNRQCAWLSKDDELNFCNFCHFSVGTLSTSNLFPYIYYNTVGGWQQHINTCV